jgi:N-methylhydantoinase A/oxoprolinase/acetone carboxylase beta subunit
MNPKIIEARSLGTGKERSPLLIIGIDVGGTHTDAVLLKDRRLFKKVKIETRPDDLVSSLLEAADDLLAEEDGNEIERVTVSTTLATNAIVQKKTDRVAMAVSTGPGLGASQLPGFDNLYFLSGYINHRGMEVARLQPGELEEIRDDITRKGIRLAGVVGKFSSRNPLHEIQIADLLKEKVDHVSLGHRMSGNLNFPRRMATAYLNAAVWPLHRHFVHDVQQFIAERGIKAPVYILKADGGTFSLAASEFSPCQTILSGPAASVMGTLHVLAPDEDAVVLDIGSTTTDIALFARGVPLLEPLGVTLGGYRTLIRGLRTRSIGIGGDSAVTLSDNGLAIGPDRKGPAAAMGGPAPTPTDAMIVSGRLAIGRREGAVQALHSLAEPLGKTVTEVAEAIFNLTCNSIAQAVRDTIEEVNRRPVYTIHELLEGKTLSPRAIYVVGGPAGIMASPIAERLSFVPHVPGYAEVANAVGAALARTTAEVTLLADTERGILTFGEEGLTMTISSDFTREEAMALAREKLRERALDIGADPVGLAVEITEDQVFPMVRDFYTTGKNIRVKAQIKPGLLFYPELGVPI